MLQSFDESSCLCATFTELPTRRYVGDPYYVGAHCANLESTSHRYFLQHDGGGHVVARVAAIIGSCEWRRQPVGILGLYDAIAGTSPPLTNEMIVAACNYLKAAGCQIAIGPLNGSTWFDYRFAMQGASRPFFLDVYNPDEYLSHWLNAGFAPIEHYLTFAFEREHFALSRGTGVSRQTIDRGVTVTSVCSQDIQNVFSEIHGLCLEAFVDNPLFVPIEFDAFADLYRPLAGLIDPELTLTARDSNGKLLGFCFAFPDLFDAERRSLVLKTVAVRRDRLGTGLGSRLVQVVHQRAHERGIDRIYHALMHENNPSTKVRAKSARIYKRYVLLGRPL